MQSAITVDCVVIGTGAAGLAAALALADAGLETVSVGPAIPPGASHDLRTSALFAGSVAFLRHLGVWRHLEHAATPLVGLRLVDDTGGVLRAPETLFCAQEAGLDAFGYNVENVSLLEGLNEHARAARNLRLLHDEVTALTFAGELVALSLAQGGSIQARLAVGADGRKSLARTSAAIGVRQWAYPQNAIVTRFRHARPHGGVSTEFHRGTGPLTTVPLQGDASSLVWVEQPAEAARLMALTPDGFARELELRLQGLLGTVSEVGARAAFPLSGLSADRMAGHRIALVGEAAHVLPPIGAQGLNIGLRDAATLAEVLADLGSPSPDPGNSRSLAEYARRRQTDVLSRSIAVDLLNRSLISGLVPLHLVRGAGLHIVAAVPWLRRMIMQEGMQPSSDLPRVMRPPLSGS